MLLILLPFVSGCFQSVEESKTSLINNPGGKYEFQVNKNYQEVYRIAKNHLQGTGDLWTDIKQGTITCYIEDVAVFNCYESVYVYADIKAIDEQNTNVIIYYRHNGWKDTAKETMELIKK